MRRYERGPPKGGLIRMGIRGIAGGVGLVSEGLKARKDHTSTKQEEEAIQGHHGDDPFKAVSNRDTSAVEGSPPSYTSATNSKANHDEPLAVNEKQIQPSSSEYIDDQHKDTDLNESKLEDSLENDWNLDEAQVEMTGELEENPPSYSM